MIEINKIINIEDKYDNLIENKTMIFDIETTGFSRKYNRIYLIGFITKDDDVYSFHQYMTQSPEDEIILLEKFKEISSSYSNMITFNGEAFDFPFVEERMKNHGISFDFKDKSSLDLYKYIRNTGYLLDIENFKLKTLERKIGIYREDIFSGGDLIELYYAYERGDKKLEVPLLLHNEEDILNLPKILEYINIIKDLNTLNIGNNRFFIENIKLNQKGLNISGKSTIKTAYFSKNNSEIIIKDSKLDIIDRVESGSYSEDTKCLYVDKKGFILECNYGILSPNQIYLLKHGNNVLYKNIFDYIKVLLSDFLL